MDVLVVMAMAMLITVLMVMVMMSILGVAVIGNRAVPVLDAPIGQMCMVMLVIVEGNAGAGRAKQSTIVLALADGSRRSPATDMAIETYNRICRCHHHMQIVRNHQDAAAGLVPDLADQLIERRLSGEIHALDWLIQNQQVRISGNCTRKKRTLKFTAGQVLYFRLHKMRNRNRIQRRIQPVLAQWSRKPHQPFDR